MLTSEERARAQSQIWAERVQNLENLIEDIKSALNTEENGDALVEVARKACRAEQALAAYQRQAEDCTCQQGA